MCKKTDCDHIIGLYEGFGGDPYEYEPRLIKKSSESYAMVDVEFAFCPMCGEDLTNV